MDLERTRRMGVLELKRTVAHGAKLQLETLAGRIHEMTDLLIFKPEEIDAGAVKVAAEKYAELQGQYTELLKEIVNLRKSVQ